MKLVLLPGLDGTGILFEPLLKALPENLTPVVVQYPGDLPLSYAQLLERIVAELPSPEPFILLGESFSGPLALRIAAACPAGLKGVILSASFARNPVRFFPKACRPLIRPYLFGRSARILAARAMLAGYTTPPLMELVRRAHKAVTPEVLAARTREIVAVDVEDVLASCRYPMLYLAGSRDRVVGRHNQTRIKKINPNVTIVELPAAHLLLQGAPEAAAQAISEFAASVASVETRRETPLPCRHISVSIERPPAEVYAFVADPRNLPKWAAGLGGAIKRSGADWIVETAQGPAKIRFAPTNELGVLDHHVTVAPGVEIYVPIRVIPNGSGSEVILTLFRLSEMGDEKYAEDQKMVERDLGELKKILET